MTHDDVVSAFNELGYESTFPAVAAYLRNAGTAPNLKVETLYVAYPSKEALGESWLSDFVPAPAIATLREAFITVVSELLAALESRRDFSRAWLAGMKRTGALHLVQLQRLHDQLHQFFVSWLDTHKGDVSLPANLSLLETKEDIADAISALAFWLVLHWETDRSTEYGITQKMTESCAYLLDGLLIARADFAGAGLLFHLHRLADQEHQRFLKPLLDAFLTPERAGRLLDPVSLLEILRTLHPSPAQRP